MRILLIGAVVFLAAWFTILKPGGGEEEIATVAPANVAPATTEQAEDAATPAAEDTTVAATAIPAEVLAKFPKDVAKALKARKTLVLGVFTDDAKSYRPMADDDRYVRNALEKTNRYDGEVVAKNISVADLVDYAPLVNGLAVKQSPAVVVIDRDLQGTVLTGYVDRVAINQAIADARRESIVPAITDQYLRSANAICARFEMQYARWSLPTVKGKKARKAAWKRAMKVAKQERAAVAKLAAPARYKSLKALWLRVSDNAIEHNGYATLAYLMDDTSAGDAARAKFDRAAANKLDRRFDALGVTECASNRRS